MSLPFQIRQSTAKQVYGRQLHSLLESGRMHEQSVPLERDLDSYAKMNLDADVAHLKQVRKHMVAGSRYQIEAASARPADVHAATAIHKIIELGLGQRFVEARFNLAEGVFRGSAYARMNGRMHWTSQLDTTKIPRQIWMPTELVDVDRRRFDKVTHHLDRGLPTERIEAEWRMFDEVHNDWRQWEHPEWYVKHTYNADEASLGYGQGLDGPMYFYWRAKEILLKSGLQGAERWALGFMVASVDNARSASSGKTNQAIVNSFIAELNKQRSQHFFIKDKLDELEVLPGPGQGWEIVKFMLEYCDTKLRQLCLGASLPTSASKGGSYALGEIQQGTTDVLIKYDRRILAETLTRDLVTFVWNVNRAVFVDMGLGAAEMPRLVILDEKINDPKLQAEINEILLRSGMALKADEAYEMVERTQPGDDDDKILPLSMQQQDGPGNGEFLMGPDGKMQGREPDSGKDKEGGPDPEKSPTGETE